MCGNGRLEQRPEDRGAFSCGDCSRVVTSPVLKRHLQVFLDCRSRPQCRVKVKLLQRSISSLLRFAAGEDGRSRDQEPWQKSSFLHLVSFWLRATK
ncbi:scaffold protein involved in DNA repair [Homo sapiens]|uniref:Scaffold protein involved in DNA repair n=3 Tax=Homininae TaxID=207598 RepID=E5RIB8_HUMAN|nr:scaffold protein involved in DNA repair [Homo sapiens]KAI4010557.1 scaffold protein involved in DNA repair [Homo sapiens]